MIIILLSIIVIKKGYSQEVVIPGNSRYNDISGGRITDLPTKVVTSVDEVYWYEEPRMGQIYFPNGDSILNHNINIRLDIAGIEIYYGSEIKVLPLALIHSVSVGLNVFVTHKYFDAQYNIPKGFYKILVDGSYSLLAHMNYEIQQQNYNAQFDVGNTKAKVFKENNFFVIGGDFEVLDLTDTRKKIACKFFPDPQLSMAFLKENRVRMKNADDLVKWVTYENRIPR